LKRLNLAGVMVVIACAMFAPCAEAQLSTHNLVNYLYAIQVCTGQYALCAAAICTPTETTIEVNTATGTAPFPEASCTCPVYKGPAIADPNGGNMQGSCAPPGPNQIWSLYWPKSNMPQQINNWSHKPSDTVAPFQLCSSTTEQVGDTFANCFSFACTLDAQRHNGVKTATCLCPLGEDPNGNSVTAATAVVTPAGQCNPSVCGEHPVGAAFSGLNGDANACLGTANDSVALTIP
jgi:hypothetical protein